MNLLHMLICVYWKYVQYVNSCVKGEQHPSPNTVCLLSPGGEVANHSAESEEGQVRYGGVKGRLSWALDSPRWVGFKNEEKM